MIEIRQTEHYIKWFEKLKDKRARARIAIRIRRVSLGNMGDVKPVGGGISELRITGMNHTLRFAGLFNLPIPMRYAFGIGVSQ